MFFYNIPCQFTQWSFKYLILEGKHNFIEKNTPQLLETS